jgi:hypothetical protein
MMWAIISERVSREGFVGVLTTRNLDPREPLIFEVVKNNDMMKIKFKLS